MQAGNESVLRTTSDGLSDASAVASQKTVSASRRKRSCHCGVGVWKWKREIVVVSEFASEGVADMRAALVTMEYLMSGLEYPKVWVVVLGRSGHDGCLHAADRIRSLNIRGVYRWSAPETTTKGLGIERGEIGGRTWVPNKKFLSTGTQQEWGELFWPIGLQRGC